MFVDDLLRDDLYNVLIEACYAEARAVYSAGRKLKLAQRDARKAEP